MTEQLVGSRLPDLRQIIVDLVLRYRMRRGGRRPLTPERMKWHAEKFEEANARVPAPAFVSFDPVDVGSSSGIPGAIPGEWVTLADKGARAGAPGVVLYFHGGGFVMGSPKTHRVVTWRIARATGRPVLAIAYRKAPDHAFPAWVDDGAAAFRWLVERGHDPKDIVIAGDSAGGNLALAVVHRLRRQREPLPAALILFSPWADLGCEGASYKKNVRRDAMFHAESVRATGSYLMRDCDPRDPEVSPVHADLTGFPPMLLFAGTRELFVDDARTIARRATANGVRAELHVYRHMPHVFPLLVDVLPRAAPAYEAIRRFVSETERAPTGRS